MMRIKLIYTIALVFFAMIIPAKAQTYFYSQYQHAPLNINPALLSVEKDTKVALHYHQNELDNDLNLKNYQVSMAFPLSWVKNEKTPQSIGFSVLYNNSGTRGLVNCTGGNLAFTQGVQIGRKSLLSAGFQASYYLYGNSNPGNYTTGSQWVDGTGFESTLSTGEQISFETQKIVTLGAGLNWHIFDGEKSKGDFGVSSFNLNEPKLTVLGSNAKLSKRYVAHASYQVAQMNRISILPRVLFVHKEDNLLSVGTVVKYAFQSENPFLLIKNCDFQLGLDYRNNGTGVVSIGIEQHKYIFGVSYTVRLNNNAVYSNYSSNIEFCFALKFRKNKQPRPSEYHLGETRLIFDKGIERSEVVTTANTKQQTINNYQSDSVYVTGEKYQVQLRQDFKFKFNAAELTPDAERYLDDLAKMLKQNSQLRVEVIGHTDDVGTDEANLKISTLRAKIVVDYLVSKGIDNKRLKVTPKGKSEPVFPNNSDENRSKNRRVEFIIYNN